VTRPERWTWALLAAILAFALLLLARSVAAIDATFMPKGGRALLVELMGADEAQLRAVAIARRTESEWNEQLAARKSLSDRERATLAAYLAGNMPLAPDVASRSGLAQSLPPDGRDLAWNECQSCHSLFTSYLTQSRDAQGWRNLFLSPFHKQMKLTPAQRDEFARYAALNMPMKPDDVPQDLRY
jgi:hypothetical protein